MVGEGAVTTRLLRARGIIEQQFHHELVGKAFQILAQN
jgi:hypothetical protein